MGNFDFEILGRLRTSSTADEDRLKKEFSWLTSKFDNQIKQKDVDKFRKWTMANETKVYQMQFKVTLEGDPEVMSLTEFFKLLDVIAE